jgi:hypothetical protein
MKVLCFCPVKQPLDRDIHDKDMVELMLSKKAVMSQTLDDLLGQLRSPEHRPDVAILRVNHKRELMSLVEMSWLLDGISIVLLLPNQKDDELIELAHKLRPRFIGFLSYGIGVIEAVLGKMLTSSQR